MQAGLQEWIHKLEEGEGTRWIKFAVLFLAFCALIFVYHSREAKTFRSVEAMEAAQLARNLSRGEGFVTKSISPVSIALAQQAKGDVSVIKQGHPDLTNPPLYPLLLAAAMKVLPFQWDIPEKSFWRYQPEILIGICNQLLFCALIAQVFFLGRRLFDSGVAWLSAILVAATELFWEFTTSGLSTILLLNIFLAAVWCLLRVEEASAPDELATPLVEGEVAVPKKSNALLWAGLAGVITALGALTRYSFGWLIIPVVLFIALYGGVRRVASAVAAVAAFLVLLSPWLYRNYVESHTLFGVAGLHIHEETSTFPGVRLERSLPKNVETQLNLAPLSDYPRKFMLNTQEMVSRDLPTFGGSWISGFFLAGLLVPFRKPALSRLRYFLMAALTVLFIAQALGRTYRSDHSPVINSENLLVIVAPLVFLYGVALFFTLLDQIEFPSPAVRQTAVWAFGVIVSLPLILTLLPPRSYPVDYPRVPYFPPAVQRVAGWMETNELMMSDMPWAVAWYGDRSCVWITLDHGKKGESDFFKINDFQKPIQGLYLTPITMDSKFLTQMLKSPDGEWCRFVLDSILRTNVPTGFPLKKAPTGLFPEQVFLTDRARWKK
jgi:hypothetical protein